MKKNKNQKISFDTHLGHLVNETDTSSIRIRNKLSRRYEWCFCELCGNPTEYVVALEARKVFKRLEKGAAKAVSLTDQIFKTARQKADALVERYIQALAGANRYAPAQLINRYCNFEELGGDFSVEAFRDQVERRLLMSEWAKHGDILNAVRMPGEDPSAPKPSRLYCSMHNPRRSIEARRAYQRDRLLIDDFLN